MSCLRGFTRKHRRLILGSLLLLAAVNLGAAWTLRRCGLCTRFIPVNDFSTLSLREPPPEALAPFAARFHGEDPLALMAEVMDRVSRIEPYDTADAAQLLRHVEQGGGTLCGGMARLLYYALSAKGYPARMVCLVRNLGDPSDTHVVVEVRQAGRWFVLDPTFNVTYERGGQRLGVREMTDAVYDGSLAAVQPRFNGDVRYPARLDSYGMDWKPLFNNMFIVDPHRADWGWLPIVRWWHGAVQYYPAGPAATGHIVLVNRVAWFVMVALPSGISLLAVLAAVGWCPLRQRTPHGIVAPRLRDAAAAGRAA